MLLITLPHLAFSQSKFKQFRELPGPLKRWTLSHLWVAGRAQAVSARALVLADSMRGSAELDGDWNGGSLDAFRHGIWMAMLVQRMSCGKARRLGEAYERWNHQQFLRRELEEGLLPDAASSAMDRHNNGVGREMGLEMRKGRVLPAEGDLVAAVIAAVRDGNMLVIWKDSPGNCLDCEGRVIPKEEWQGEWVNERCLIASNRRRTN